MILTNIEFYELMLMSDEHFCKNSYQLLEGFFHFIFSIPLFLQQILVAEFKFLFSYCFDVI